MCETGDRRAEGIAGQCQVQHRIVNAGEVAAAAGLVLLGADREGVHVDTRGRGGRVVLEGLHHVEVVTLALRKPVVAVELQLGNRRGVLQAGIRVAPRLIVLAVAVEVVGVLHNPHEFLDGVVEVEFETVRTRRNRLLTRELQLLDEVLVGNLREAATLLRIQVDVVDPQRGRDQALAVDNGDVGCDVGVDKVASLVELDVDLHLVVLESNQGERKPVVTVKPELQRHIQCSLRHALCRSIHVANIDTITQTVRAVRDHLREGHCAERTTLRLDVRRRIATVADTRALGNLVTTVAVHHAQVVLGLARRKREFIPDVQPVAIVLVDQLSTDLDLDVLDQILAHIRDPREVARNIRLCNRRQSSLQVDLADKVTIACNGARHLLAERGNTVKRLLNGLHREVRVTTIQLLEEGNLRVSRQIYVLGTIRDELQETTTTSRHL